MIVKPAFLFFICSRFFLCASGNSPDTAAQQSSNIVCTFYIQDESQIVKKICLSDVGTIQEPLCSNESGEIILQNIPPGCYSFWCFYYDTITFLDNIYLGPSLNRIRLYDYLFEKDKKMVDEAAGDISKGSIKILAYGFYLKNEKLQELTAKYGFRYEYTGCASTGEELYNSIVYNYLDKINGSGWRDKFSKEYEQIIKQQFRSKQTFDKNP